MGLIYIDTCLVVYLVERHPDYYQMIKDRLTNQDPNTTLAISPLIKLECLVKPMRDGDNMLQRRYQRYFAFCRVLELTESVYEQATHLRARFGIRTPDALHLACAQHHGCTAFWTNDHRLERSAHGLALALVN